MKLRLVGILAMITALSVSVTSQEYSKEKQDSSALGQSSVPAVQSLKSIKKVFIDAMPNNLDQYLRVEFQKQFKGKVLVVLAKEDADAVLTGVGDWQKGTGAAITGRYLGLHDTATGSVSLVSCDGKVLLWAGEAGDRSLWWGALARSGPRKVADRIVSKLKHDME